MKHLEDYASIVGDEVISQIHRKSRRFYGKNVLHINSTYQGGGVAELLSSLIPLLNDLGINCEWRILHGNPDFFGITKKFHNALQGDKINITDIKKEIYYQTNEDFSVYSHIDHDYVVIHDPQPLPLIRFNKKRQPWVWRCHIDLSHPSERLWEFLKPMILRYDKVVVSSEKYKKQDFPVDYKIIPPAIDPLSAKNMDLSERDIQSYLDKFEIPTDKPLITQISRFDKWKDPEGMLEIFRLIKKKIDCRLILCGSMASDDPEGWLIYSRVLKKANPFLSNKDIILITSENNFLVNVLQRVSAVIIQKSIREGFGLTVTEAQWKGKPVIASNVGGIPLQIQDRDNGFLLEPYDYQGFAERIIQVLKNPEMATEIGIQAKESVRKKFLITRLLTDYLDMFKELDLGIY